ncbi:MAG: ATP-binding cassette domain-containing protein [Bacillus sp. (in: Bacteria)]|nr:ATP-binding cassette domain-containing protein [Bacillus sp. (in: firmicutes)]MCM1426780.1 ATP-binding cassette domain-containing protein [Eubacterium sp.]
MAKINVSNLTFCYEGSFDNIFENVSFSIDTDWKLGFIGRNGKGKTTFLNLLMDKYEYRGSIQTSVAFDYFPYQVSEEQMKSCAADFCDELASDLELWRILMEMEKMGMDAELLYRPFQALSHGERTRVMLAVLFSRDNYFLLIDEPTNHLDRKSREIIKEYLRKKQGFLLVSHDRDLLDACIDHILVLNRVSIEVQKGNFSSWWENKSRMDAFHEAENEKHRKEIGKLQEAARRADGWAQKNEDSKIGYDPIKEHDRSLDTRAYIGAKTKAMQKRVKQMQVRIAHEIEEKEGLLQDIENPADLKIMPLVHHKNILIRVQKYGLSYGEHGVLQEFDFTLQQGERVLLCGANGSGKSSFIKAVLRRCGAQGAEEMQSPKERRSVETAMQGAGIAAGNGTVRDGIIENGVLQTASGLIISYVNQDASYLKGDLKGFCQKENLEESLLKAILRQLDFERIQFGKRMEEYSEGQKKKVLIAASLLKRAHLYIWDEPLNYIDVFSRMQIEELILRYQPTMLLVEHDVRFQEKVATRVVEF